MSHKIAKRIRRMLKDLGIDPKFTQYNNVGTISLNASCGRKIYQDMKKDVRHV